MLSLYLSIPWSLCLYLYYLVVLVRSSSFPVPHGYLARFTQPSAAFHTHSLHPPSPFPRSHMAMGRSTSTSYLPHVSLTSLLSSWRSSRLLPMFDVIPDGLTPRSHLIGHTPSSVAPPPPLLPQSAGDLEVPARNTAVMPHVGGATRNQVQGEADLRASGLNPDSQLLLSVFGCHSCYTKRIRAA